MITSVYTSREAAAVAMQKSKPKKRYNSLSEFRDYLEQNQLETVVSFTGYELTTKTTRYWMIDGQVYSEQRGRGRKG